MNLHEYQAKDLFRRHGIPVPDGLAVHSAAEARAFAEKVGRPVAVKAQVHAGGRGKAGGILMAASPSQAAAAATALLGTRLMGHGVRAVLMEPAATIDRELYLSVVLDRSDRRPVIVASANGGVDVEEVAASRPDAVLREPVEPLLGPQAYQLRRLALGLGLAGAQAAAFTTIAARLWDAYDSLDATLAEINPLAILDDGALVALDAKIDLDDNGLFRHPDTAAMRDPGDETAAEIAARDEGLSYVSLGGSIGCLVNGAGLAMATMDVVKLFGGEPANFLDVGGGARSDRVSAAVRLLLGEPQVACLLVNVFGGITRCDEVASGILAALGDTPSHVPIVVRLAGTSAAEGRAILSAARIRTAATLAEGARMAVAIAQGQAGP